MAITNMLNCLRKHAVMCWHNEF